MQQEQGASKGGGDIEDVPDNSSIALDDAPDNTRIEAVYKKLDRRIIPAFWVLYFLASAVRSNVGLAQTMNSAQGHDLASVVNITPKQISTGLALFFVFYVVFNLPSNLIMSYMSPHVWMARIMVLVGVIGACMAAMDSAGSFYALRILLGTFIAGLWPGLTYYLTLFYPPSRIGTRIGYYFTASQVSAAVVGLVSAGFQRMDGLGGLVGFQWMFLLYGLVTLIVGVVLLWWLPDRPLPPGEVKERSRLARWMPSNTPALSGADAQIHYTELRRVYRAPHWSGRDLLAVLADWRLWPLTLMYFGVVGVGFGVQNYGTVIIRSINPSLSSINLSLLFAPIWVCDLIAILIVTPLSDKYKEHRALFFNAAVAVQILGLLLTTFLPASRSWGRYVGLLLIGFGLGPTVPICMTWTSELFQARHGEVGVAAASAVVSGLGNLGSVTTTYALYTGWAADGRGKDPYRKSNLVMVGILGMSVLSAAGLVVMLEVLGRKRGDRGVEFEDDAARRERVQRGEGRGRLWGRGR